MRKVTTQFFAVLVATVSVVGCSKTSNPLQPTQLSNSAAGDLVLKGAVAGRNEAGNVPLSGVEVTLTNGSNRRSASTDEGGEFIVDGLSAGTWMVSLTKAGYTGERLSVSVDGETNVSFALDPYEPPSDSDRAERNHRQ